MQEIIRQIKLTHCCIQYTCRLNHIVIMKNIFWGNHSYIINITIPSLEKNDHCWSLVVVQQADMEKPNVGYEVTKEVVKLMQELQGVLELWSYWLRLLGHWVGDGCHWDSGRREGRQGGEQGGKGGHQGVNKGSKCWNWIFSCRDNSSFKFNSLGPLWQCFLIIPNSYQ